MHRMVGSVYLKREDPSTGASTDIDWGALISIGWVHLSASDGSIRCLIGAPMRKSVSEKLLRSRGMNYFNQGCYSNVRGIEFFYSSPKLQ